MKGRSKSVSRPFLLTIAHSLAHRVKLHIYKELRKSVSDVSYFPFSYIKKKKGGREG